MSESRELLKRISLFIHWRSWHGRLIVWLAAALTALGIVFFAQLVDVAIQTFNQLRNQFIWLPFILTPMGGAAIVWMTRNFFPSAAGSGIPQVMAALRESNDSTIYSRLVSLPIAIAKALLTTAALACGFSVGREGPSVQVGASIMYSFRNLLPKRFPVQPHQLILAGGAAGLAAAFNTPLAGIVFAIEELGRKFEEKTNGVLLTAIILAGAISISIQGNYTYFGHFIVVDVDRQLLVPVLLSAIIGGISGGIFSRLILWSSDSNSRFGRWREEHPLNPYKIVVICGVVIAGLGVLSAGHIHGSGYLATREVLEGQSNLSFLFAAEKILATLLSYLSGIPGGIFAPSLAIGAGLGEGMASLLPANVETVVWIALCMTAFLAGVTQAPITCFVIVMEMVDGHTMVVSLMTASFLSSLISRFFSRPLYQTLSYQVAKKARSASSAAASSSL